MTRATKRGVVEKSFGALCLPDLTYRIPDGQPRIVTFDRDRELSSRPLDELARGVLFLTDPYSRVVTEIRIPELSISARTASCRR